MQDFTAGLYIRLSREGGDKGVSDSILNQEKLLKNYVEEKEDINFGDCYIDEDYTGTNFNRPGFQRMMDDLKSGAINCIIIKDLSRLGRNFIESSRYIEEVFPKHNCRFISVLDNVDSYENPDINTDLLLRLKNLIHDNNSQEISKKVRAVKDMQRKEGKHISNFTPYGYMKDPNNKYKLIVDKSVSHIVKSIFEWYLNGMGIIRIAERLNRYSILSPGDYKRKSGIYKDTNPKNTGWYPFIIRVILTTKAYTGDLDQRRTTTINYKDRKLIRLDDKDHIIIPNAHEPIFEQHIFEKAQEKLKNHKLRTSPSREKVYLFSGLMRCADCQYGMIRTATTIKGKKYVYYKCRSYNQRGKSVCSSSHSVREELIYAAVRCQINSNLNNLIDIKRTINNYNKSNKENNLTANILKIIEQNGKKIKKIENLKIAIYADYKKEILNEDEFLNMKKSYSKELLKLEKDIILLKEELKSENHTEKCVTPWIEEIIQYGRIFALDREIITKLVDKIYVTADKKINVKFKYENILIALLKIYTMLIQILWEVYMQTASANNPQRIWNTAIYVRISEAEKDKSESDSIVNQKKYIQKFIGKDSTLNLHEIYCDDGYSGGNFDRPAFQKLISDIDKKIVDCVIVKDLSRFGREHIKTNYYMEIYFPSNKVRFISLGENIDSYLNPKRMESIDIPFTNLINDHYLTQVSISTKSSLQIKQKEGKFVGALAPYGYLKAPYDKHKLIIDEEVKDIVVKIFNDYIKGSTLSEIAKALNYSKILSPGVHRAKKSGRIVACKWNSNAVRNILDQPIYTGDMVQGRTYSPNHKVKKRIPQPKEKWILVKNTHEAIISRKIYDKAQDILSRDIKPVRQKCKEIKPSILAGYVYCADCGGKMIRNSAVSNGKKIYRFVCSTYKNKGGKYCSSRYIQEDKLIELLFETISLYTRIAVDEAFVKRAEEMHRKGNVSSFFAIKLKKAQKELEEVKMIRQGLYKDYKLNIISASEYTDMKAGFEQQYNDLLKQISSLSKSIEFEKTKKLPINETLEYLKGHGDKTGRQDNYRRQK